MYISVICGGRCSAAASGFANFMLGLTWIAMAELSATVRVAVVFKLQRSSDVAPQRLINQRDPNVQELLQVSNGVV